MKMFSECSGPCETCKIFHLPLSCLAGHGDDDYIRASQEWIEACKRKYANADKNKEMGVEQTTD